MKNYTRLVTILLVLIMTGMSRAQNIQSEFINYQGVARTSDGEVIANDDINIQIGVRIGAQDVASSYIENHVASTDAGGVFSLQIGNGTPVSGDYNPTEWNGFAPYINVLLNGDDLGTTEMHAVPYASLTSRALDMNLNDLTDVNGPAPTAGQVLKWDGSDWQPGTDEAGDENLWTENAGDISYTGGSVGIGTSTPEAPSRLHITGNAFLQTNTGDFQLGFPDNGHRWAMATIGNGANLLFRSKPDGSASYTTRFRFEQNGMLGINGAPTSRLEIFQGGQTVGLGLRFDDGTANEVWDITHGFALRFHYGGALRGLINANTGAYVQSSDASMKDNIKPLATILERLKLLKPSTYYYKSDKTKSQTIGLVAQETIHLFPELVTFSEADGKYGVDYAAFSIVAIKAIQEQQEKIKSLEERLAALEKN